MNEQKAPAVAGRVEQPVRPCAWALQAELDARETTCRAHLWFVDPVNSAWAPLYDQASLDAAVATERERLLTQAKKCTGQEASAAAHYAGKWHAAHERHLIRHAAMRDLIDALEGPNAAHNPAPSGVRR